MKNSVLTKDGVKVEKRSNKYKGHIFYDEKGGSYQCLGFYPKFDECVYLDLQTGKHVVGCMDGFYFSNPIKKKAEGGNVEVGQGVRSALREAEIKDKANMLINTTDWLSDKEVAGFIRFEKGRYKSKEDFLEGINKAIKSLNSSPSDDKKTIAFLKNFLKKVKKHIQEGKVDYAKGGAVKGDGIRKNASFLSDKEVAGFIRFQKGVYKSKEDFLEDINKAIKSLNSHPIDNKNQIAFLKKVKKHLQEGKVDYAKGGNIGTLNYSIGGL